MPSHRVASAATPVPAAAHLAPVPGGSSRTARAGRPRGRAARLAVVGAVVGSQALVVGALGVQDAAASPGLIGRRALAAQATQTAVQADSGAAASTVPTAPLMISPTGGGRHDGSSWANAGTLDDLPRFLAARPLGGQIWVRGDAGPYVTTGSIKLKTGGVPGNPVVVRGVDASGGSSVRPLFVGKRSAPWHKGGATGSEVFKLYTGASDLVFSNLAFRDLGTVVAAGGDVARVQVQDVTATNVQRFFENYRAGGERSANLADITLRRIDVRGFSKSVVRLQYDTHRVLIEDVTGDSQQQDGDDFAMGVHLDGTVHDVVLRRVTMRNAKDSTSDYWNGDGFATERGVYRVRFEDTASTGNTDGGYDIKSIATVLIHAYAADNKRNYRLWANDTVVLGCQALAPQKRGGSSSQAQFWLGAGAKVTVADCTISDRSPATHVFELENKARLTVQRSIVTRAPAATLKQVESGAAVEMQATSLAVS